MSAEIIDFDIEVGTTLVNDAWADVFKASDIVIKHSQMYGFDGIELIPNPNIHQLLAAVNVVSGMLDSIAEQLNYNISLLSVDDTRLLFNAKQQLLKLKQIATALIARDKILYDEFIGDLKRQARI